MLTAYWIFFSLLLCIFFVCFWCFPFHSKLPLLGNWPLGKPLSRWILKLSPASLVPRNNFYNKMLACWKWWEMLNIDILNHEKICLQLLLCLETISTRRCWGWICSSCAAGTILDIVTVDILIKKCLKPLSCLKTIFTRRCWGWICSSCAAGKILDIVTVDILIMKCLKPLSCLRTISMRRCWWWREMLNIDIFNHEKNCLQLLCCLGIISTIRCWGWICSSCAAEKILSLFITWSKNVSSLSRAWEKF